MQRKHIPQLWKFFLATAVLLCFVGCGRQEAAIPFGDSEGLESESPEGSMQGEIQQESNEQSAERQPDDAGLDRQPEQVLSKERTTAAFDVGSFFELNLVVGGDCIYGFGRRQKGGKAYCSRSGLKTGTLKRSWNRR